MVSGSARTWIAANAVQQSTTGSFNTAVGARALDLNTADDNTETGAAALSLNTTGFDNTANGVEALVSNTLGVDNTASGAFALFSNTTGGTHTANGEFALFSNTTGASNTAIGASALANATGSGGNTALGFEAGIGVTTAGGVTCISSPGQNVTNTTWIGNVYGVATESDITAPVIVSDTGQLGIVASSERFKKDIATMENASEAILSLRPVTFHYKSDTKGTPQFGLIADEVADVNPDIVVRDKNGEIYTVRYDAVNAMLLNEFLKEHRKVEDLKKDFQATVAQQQKEIAALAATVKEQAAQIQRVSTQLEASKPAPQVVNNP